MVGYVGFESGLILCFPVVETENENRKEREREREWKRERESVCERQVREKAGPDKHTLSVNIHMNIAMMRLVGIEI